MQLNYSQKMSVMYIVFLVVLTFDSGMAQSESSLIFNKAEVIVNEGDSLALDCGFETDIRSCFWQKEGDATIHQVQDIRTDSSGEFSRPLQPGRGNKCGILINRVSIRHHGVWKCTVLVPKRAFHAQKNVIVAVQPRPPILDINESPYMAKENEEELIDCIVTESRPAARIRWFIGTEDVTANSRSENAVQEQQGIVKTTSQLKYKFSHYQDRLVLKCSVQHVTLDEPLESKVSLDIRYAPYGLGTTRFYGVPVSTDEYEIKFNVTSNPVPDLMWRIGRERTLSVPGEDDKYVANIRELVENTYMATLKIKEFTENDLGRMYKLAANNDYGAREFVITLSTEPPPPENIAGGALAAIVIIVVFIIVLLCIIGIMRYRQMYCFGSQDKVKDHMKQSGENLREEYSDTESAAREPNSGKASKFFKNVTSLIKPKKTQEEDESKLDRMEEGRGVKESSEAVDSKTKNGSKEIVYAELDLKSNNSDPKPLIAPSTTEYAEIINPKKMKGRRNK